MRQSTSTLHVDTRGKEFYQITREVRAWVADQRVAMGLLTVFCRHTSASLLIQENADPDVRADLLAFLDDIAPETRTWVHDAEGPDDMPAHVRTMLTQTSVSIPVVGGAPVLGTWQGIFLVEHRAAPHRRDVVLHLIGA